MIIETVSQDQLNALSRCLSPMARIVCRLHEADLARGRGVLEGNERCLWTKDGRRITISPLTTGGLIASVGKDTDPEAPPVPVVNNDSTVSN